MNINNFESYIDRKILDKGYNYYIEGCIVGIKNPRSLEYIFDVEGSDNYEVVVTIDKSEEIVSSYCDCPYDLGPICKHEVAAYFNLFEILNGAEDFNKKADIKNINQLELSEVLLRLSKDELIDIIVDLAQSDISLEESIIFKYSKGNEKQEIEACKKAINSIVKKYLGREGFVKYSETFNFANELGDLLEKCRNTDNALVALESALLVLEEAVESFQYADDSAGEIGSLVEETIDVIDEIVNDAENLNTEIRIQLFEKIIHQSESEIFEGWEDFRLALLRVCISFASDEQLRNKLRMKVASLLYNDDSTNRYVHYSNEALLQILLQIIEKYGTKVEVEQFIKDNLQYASFREMYINILSTEKNYQKIIDVALAAEKQDQQYPGLVTRWKKLRYNAYKKLSLKGEQQKLAKELFLGGDFDYYKELKQLSEEDEAAFYSKLKDEIKIGKGWNQRNLLLKLIEEENDIDEMISYVRNNPRSIEEYADKLIEDFQSEVLEIYHQWIHIEARNASNRKMYKDVCRIIRRYKKIAGIEKQDEIVKELTDLYRKRPAFIDELSKI